MPRQCINAGHENRVKTRHRKASVAKRPFMALVFLAIPIVMPLYAATASAAPPQLLSVTSENRHLTANWSSPPGIQRTELLISSENRPSDDFGLEGPGYAFMAPMDFPAEATSFTTPSQLDVGTYYVRVGGDDPNDSDPSVVWSNIVSVDVLPLAIPAGARKYKGKTKQEEPIKIVATGKEVLLVVATVDCHGYSTGGNRRIEGPVPINSKHFVLREEQVGGGGSEVITVNGNFKAKGKVTGRIVFAVEDDYRGVNCVAKIPFSASRVKPKH